MDSDMKLTVDIQSMYIFTKLHQLLTDNLLVQHQLTEMTSSYSIVTLRQYVHSCFL